MLEHGVLFWLIIGALAGWLAGKLMRGRGFGLIGNIVAGVIGAFIGGWLAGVAGLHIGSGLTASLITATAGAVVLIFVTGLIRR